MKTPSSPPATNPAEGDEQASQLQVQRDPLTQACLVPLGMFLLVMLAATTLQRAARERFDRQQVYPQALAAYRIDINSADAATLATLPGIGPAKAKAIIASREQLGPFVEWDDLTRVRGIGPKTVRQVQRHGRITRADMPAKPVQRQVASGEPGAEIVRIIDECPPWTTLTAEDVAGRARAVETLTRLTRYPTGLLREAYELYLQDEGRRDSIDDQSKLFLLNKMLFAVTEKVSRAKAKHFGGWIGVPSDDDTVDLLWPLSLGSDGSFQLTGNYAGYVGAPYFPLREFDYYLQTFGRRSSGDESGHQVKPSAP